MNKTLPDLALAVDIGGTNTRTALIDSQGGLLRRLSIATQPEQGAQAGIERIVAAMRQVAAATESRQLAGIGIAMPGLIDVHRGVSLKLANLPGWEMAPVRDLLAQAFGLPAYIGNDANLAALGEQRFGAARGVDDMIYMTIGTGIGGGIVCGGRLLTGADGFAGEIGHQTIDSNGPLCACGNRGCLEVLAAGPAIVRAARVALAAGESSLLLDLAHGEPAAVNGEIIAQAAAQSDALALRVVDQAGRHIGFGIVNLIHIFNPRLVALGGGVTQIGEPLWHRIRETVSVYAIADDREALRIVPAALGDDAGLLGAAALVFSNVQSNV